MTKTSFYTLVKDAQTQNRACRVMVTGYSDGTFYYYKTGSTWYAVHPLCGLTISAELTRKSAQSAAHKKFRDVLAFTNRMGESATQFFLSAPKFDTLEKRMIPINPSIYREEYHEKIFCNNLE